MKLKKNQISEVDCPLCGYAKKIKMFEVSDHEYKTTDDKFTLNKCIKCEMVYLSPRPNLKSLEIIYPKNYNNFHTDDTKESYVRTISNKLQAKRLKSLIDKYIRRSYFNVLDVGCGDGFVLDRIKDVYPNAQTYGVEPNSVAARRASKKHKIFTGIIEDYNTEKKFDLIVSSHVVEHVEKPLIFLKKLKKFLADDGVMIIDTPNIDCFQFKLFNKNWGGIHAPRHWTLFDLKTMAYLAEKTDLQVIKIQQLPINSFWVWSIHSWLYHKPKLKNFSDKYFNTIDCVSGKSIYYLMLMIFAEVIERITGFFGLGLGQQRAILKKI